jgi:hypothetical protein
MPATAPTLTWQMTALRQVVAPTDPQSVLDTVALCVGDVTRWEVKSSAAGYVELGPIAASATPNVRLLIAFGVNTAQVRAPHTNVAGVLYMGIAPDGGTLGDPFGAGAPYGVARWSGYWRLTGDIDGGQDADQVFCIGSDEVLSLWFEEAASDDWFGGVGGPLILGPTDADGDGGAGSLGRVYGMCVSGSTLINGTFWNSNTQFTSSSGGNDDPVVGVFEPGAPATFSDVDRYAMTILAAPRQITAGGTQVSFPVGVFFENAPLNYVGVYRQMRFATDGRMRTIIQDSGAVDKSYWVSGATLSDGDVWSFDQG